MKGISTALFLPLWPACASCEFPSQPVIPFHSFEASTALGLYCGPAHLAESSMQLPTMFKLGAYCHLCLPNKRMPHSA